MLSLIKNNWQPVSFVFQKVDLSEEFCNFPLQGGNGCLPLLRISIQFSLIMKTAIPTRLNYCFTLSLYSFSLSLSPSSKFWLL